MYCEGRNTRIKLISLHLGIYIFMYHAQTGMINQEMSWQVVNHQAFRSYLGTRQPTLLAVLKFFFCYSMTSHIMQSQNDLPMTYRCHTKTGWVQGLILIRGCLKIFRQHACRVCDRHSGSHSGSLFMWAVWVFKRRHGLCSSPPGATPQSLWETWLWYPTIELVWSHCDIEKLDNVSSDDMGPGVLQTINKNMCMLFDFLIV